MKNSGWLWLGVGAWCLLGCSSGHGGQAAGGQSGTEGGTPACANVRANPIGLDDSTPFGTARQLFSNALAFSEPPTNMQWNSPTDGSSFATSITYALSGTPTDAVYTADPAPNCTAGFALSVSGATLHFQSADGTFDESVSGELSVLNGASIVFAGEPSTPFTGSYDIDSALKKFPHPKVELETPLGSGPGWLVVVDSVTDDSFRIASWQNSAVSGAGGSTSYGGSGGTDTDSGVAGDDGAAGAATDQ